MRGSDATEQPSQSRISLAEFREQMGALADGMTDAELGAWQSRLDRLARALLEWQEGRERTERAGARRTAPSAD